MVSNQDAKNLLVNWLNKNQSSNVQTNLNKNSATNVVDPTLTNTNPVKDLKSWTKDKLRQKNVITAPAQNFSIKNNIQPTNNSGAGNVVNTPIQQPVQQQSRFIGFQNQQQQETNPIYIQPEDVKANMQNLRENIKHRTNSQALMEFQGDVYKNKGKMSKDMMTRLYPEFKDNIDVLDELQKELRPIVQDGYGVDSKQLENLYPELLQAKKLQNVADVKTKSEEANKKYETVKKKVDDALRSNIKGLSSSGLKFARDADMLFEAVETAKQRGVEGGANDNEILSFLIQNSPEAQQIWNEMNSLELTKHDRGILGYKDAGLRDELNAVANVIKDASGLTFDKATDEEIETAIKGKEALEKDFWGEVGKKISVELGVSLDSIEKGLYRNYKDWQNVLLEKGMDYAKGYITKDIKSDLEKSLGVKLTDEQVDEIKNLYEEKSKPIIEEETRKNKQNVLDYQESVNKEYESRRARLNQDIENYVNNGSMTSSLLQGDLSSFLYKSSGEAAQNVDNLLMVVGGTVAPEVVLPAMFADSYLRESQESFEELMKVQEKMGITGDEAYDNAQKGSATVGLASSLIEVGLEKVLGGVETTASKAFHDMLMKDFTEKATKMVAEKGLMELLKQGATTQFKASLEEGLEEVFQQAIHNKALQKYDPDQKITEGMLEAFEGGFYNWMNLLAGGGNVMSNLGANQETIKQGALQGAYNAGVQTRKAVDTATDIYNSVKNKVTAEKNKVTNNQTNVETNQTNNVDQNTAITPVNNNIQAQDNEVVELQDDTTATENKNTVIKEGGLTDKVLEQLNGLDENTRERIKKNPYSVQEAKDLIDEMENNPGIDFRDYQNGRYEEVLDTVLKKLEQKENKRSKDIGTLYDKLEEANAPVDVTELKNKVAEFQAQAEALEDIATPAEQAQIKTILENIEKIGDGTMDVWKVRKIADKRSKRSASSSYDGIGLIWDIRDAIDDVIVKGNPDMKEVDKSYSKVLKEIGEIKGKLFYKNGGLKSNAVSTIKNMMNAGNRIDLNNLEKYLPGIKDQLQAIDDSKFVYNAYTTGKGSRFISGIARGVFGNLGKVLGLVGFGWAGLITGAVIDAAVDKAMVSLTRKALKETITQETEKSKAELERINKKIEEGKKLDAEDKARLKELGEKIMANAEKMADTKAEKEAVDKMKEQVKEQNNEKNKVTKKKATKKNKVTEKSVDKKGTNEYNTTDASSNTSSVDLSQNEEATTGTESSSSGATPRGGELEGPTTAFSKTEKKSGKTPTQGGNFDISDVKQEYQDNYDKVINGEAVELPVGKIDGSFAYDGKERDAIFSRAINTKVDGDHGMDKQNLLGTIDKPDYIIKDFDKAKADNPDEYKEKINLIRKIPGTDNFVIVSAERQNGFFILTNYEVHRNNANRMMNELKRLARRGILAIDTIGDLTEALKEQPKNKVTAKKTEATTPKQETKVEQPKQETKVETKEEAKTETKTEDNSDLREKIGDRFYNYLKEQADRINKGRKTLAPVTIEELLTAGPYHDSTKYIDIYERDVRNKLDNIMYQIGKLDLPEVKLTEEQGNQLYEASALNGDRDILRIKWMKEWIDKNPSKASEKLTELTNEGADMVEQLEKAKAYVAEIEKTKIVDKDGNPLRVYHGTNMEGDEYGDIRTEPGYWFTEDRDYAKTHSEKGIVREANLDMKNPINIDEQEELVNGLLKDAFGDKAKRDDEHIFSKEFKNAAIKKGYDGLIFSHDDANTYIVFNKDQIIPLKPQNIVTDKANVTSKQEDNEKPKNLVTGKVEENNNVQQPEFETLPDDITVSQEAKQLGAKRIAPDRVPRQQLTFDEGVNKINDNLNTVAEYMKLRSEFYTAGNYNDSEMKHRLNTLEKEVQQILYGENGFNFQSTRSKEFNDLWKNITDNKNNPVALREVARNFYISKVKKDISKGYQFPIAVLEKIPGAQKALNARERYQKGLDTSFSAKDARIDFSEQDKIGAGIKSQDGKQVTKEQKEDIVKGIEDFGKTLGLDMKKFAEDRGLVYVHLHGGHPFLSTFGGMYREATNNQGEKNISVSVGGSENVRYKDPKTKEWKTNKLNTTMSHELGHAMDYLIDNRLFTWEQKSMLRSKYNPVNRLREYYAKGNEIVARAIEQYVAVENGQPNYYLENGNLDAGEFKGTDLEYALKEVGSYYERPGYWSKVDYEKYVKPYVEEAFRNNFEEYKITPEQKDTKANSKNTVTASDLNKVTNKVNAERVYSPTITVRLDENGNPIKKNDRNLISNKKNKVTSKTIAEPISNPIIVAREGSINRNYDRITVMDANGNYFDGEGNEIDKGSFINIKNYNSTYRKFQNAINYGNIEEQYNLIEKLNGLAHRIKKQLKRLGIESSIEEDTYEIKNDFARKEIARRGNDILRYDSKKKKYYLLRPDGSDSIHVGNEVAEEN